MRGLPAISAAEAYRVRRWDVLMLGGALPGLVAAARLGQRGLRVLIVEEELPGERDFGREPFLLVDAEPQGLLAECLRALGIPLIDQRRFVTDEVALQVCEPDCRVDLGRASHTAAEWSSWGLADADDARACVRALEEAADLERTALCETLLSLKATRRAREALTGPLKPTQPRGWPARLDDAPPALRSVLDAPLRALSNLGDQPPSGEARARLLGGLLRGGVQVSGEVQLRGLLRSRVETLYGEFRLVPGPLRLVSVSGQPGLSVVGSKEIWTGRALVLNAPAAAIAAASDEPVSDLLAAPPIRRRRHTLHFRGAVDQLSPCMAGRVVWRDRDDGECVALRVLRGRRRQDGVDLLASVVVPVGDDDAEKRGSARIERALRDLLPFAGGSLERRPLPTSRWDSDDLLADPLRGAWPDEPELRLASRPAVYGLDRASVGGLGGEGELWLGWRAGDAIADELG